MLFAYLVPTPTAPGTLAEAPPSVCQPRADWLEYEVMAGYTLLALAQAIDSSLPELRAGNCFGLVRGLFSGETVRVPRLPSAALPSPTAIFPAEGVQYPVIGCDAPAAQISAPAPLAARHGIFAIEGSATLPAGGFYRLALRPAASEAYQLYLEADSLPRAGLLGLINTEIFGTGLHRLRLTVFDSAGERLIGGVCDIPLVFSEPRRRSDS